MEKRIELFFANKANSKKKKKNTTIFENNSLKFLALFCQMKQFVKS